MHSDDLPTPYTLSTAYVCVIVRKVVGDSLTHEDVEETASDVFFALWQNADKVAKLKSWLGATTINKAINKLREVHTGLSIDDEMATLLCRWKVHKGHFNE